MNLKAVLFHIIDFFIFISFNGLINHFFSSKLAMNYTLKFNKIYYFVSFFVKTAQYFSKIFIYLNYFLMEFNLFETKILFLIIMNYKN